MISKRTLRNVSFTLKIANFLSAFPFTLDESLQPLVNDASTFRLFYFRVGILMRLIVGFGTAICTIFGLIYYSENLVQDSMFGSYILCSCMFGFTLQAVTILRYNELFSLLRNVLKFASVLGKSINGLRQINHSCSAELIELN